MNELVWKKFNALGTEIIISAFLTDEQKELLEKAEAVVFDFEKNFSRFIKGNELDRFNNLKEGVFEASDTMADLLKKAQNFNIETNGIFETAIIGSLESIGYDKSFTEIEKHGVDKKEIDIQKIAGKFIANPKIKSLKIDGNKIIKLEGLRVDFGGIGKGYLVDFLSDNLFSDVENFWISAGGDLIAKGGGENSEGWKIGVQNPGEPDKEIFSVQTKGEKIGIATSAIFKRKGETGEFKWNHLIDPRTGLPIENNIIASTAIAPTTQKADVYAKTALILGKDEGIEFIESRENSACIIFLKDGSMALSKNALKYF